MILQKYYYYIFLGSKLAKYQLADNRVEDAVATMANFTKEYPFGHIINKNNSEESRTLINVSLCRRMYVYQGKGPYGLPRVSDQIPLYKYINIGFWS